MLEVFPRIWERGGFPYVDLTDSETTDTFIETTYEAYAQQLGEHFGSTTRLMFTDEPQVENDAGFQLSYSFLEEFEREHGYPLTDRLDELCFGVGRPHEVRFDFYRTQNRLFNHNFVKRLDDWCAEHGAKLAGHYMEHEWPNPLSQPDVMDVLRFMHAPGADLLGFQFTRTDPKNQDIFLLNLKELSSVTNQMERDTVAVESAGAGGYQAAYELFKPVDDYLLAFGVNVITPHMGDQTLSGSAKYDWGQSISDHAPWFRFYRQHADHVARANTALSWGREFNRVLVLHPTTSGWIHATPPVYGPYELDRDSRTRRLADLRLSQIELIQALYTNQIDFDLGDEMMMEELGGVYGGGLGIAARRYEPVVIPPNCDNLTRGAFDLIRAYLESGGVVYALSVPSHLDGRATTEVEQIAEAYPGTWRAFESVWEVTRALRAAVPPYLSDVDGSPLPDRLVWRRTVAADGSVTWFFANPWGPHLSCEIRIEAEGLFQLDSASGEVRAAQLDSLELPPRGHAIFLDPRGAGRRRFQEAAQATPPQQPTPSQTERAATDSSGGPRETVVSLPDSKVARRSANVLVLDYCDLRVGEKTETARNTIHADTINWRAHGYPDNPWREGNQFRKNIIQRQFGRDSGFAVTYRFHIDESADERLLASLRVALERPWLYTMRINDRAIDLHACEPWLDPNIRSIDASAAVRRGPNIVELSTDRFDPLCEIMPIYLLGHFSLQPDSPGFRVVPAARLSEGLWRDAGLYHYHDAVEYEYHFSLKAEASALRVRVDDWKGSALGVALDGTDETGLLHPPYDIELPGPHEEGRHSVTIRVYGNMRNLLGPFFSNSVPVASSWKASPKQAPPGDAYLIQDCGLLRPPQVLSIAD
jgi:hypothetical protein